MNKLKSTKGLKLYILPYLNLVTFSIIIGIIMRVILYFNKQTESSLSFYDWVQVFFLGIINDLCIGIIGSFFLWLIFIFFSESKYSKPWGYFIWIILILAFLYCLFFNTIFHEYGGVVPKIVRYFLLFKCISFSIRLFIPSIRKIWRRFQYIFLIFIYIFSILFNAVCEYFFWDEFGVRYNFIAVDYLIYTNEVIGNIMESYSVIPIFSVLLIISLIVTYILLQIQKQKISFLEFSSFKEKILISGIYFLLCAFSCFGLNFTTKFQTNENVYVNELQSNGLHRFYLAFLSSELNYDKFYITLSEDEVNNLISNQYKSGKDNLQAIKDSLPEVHKNIVLITIESLSASFLDYFGNTENITPNLDSLVNESLFFTNMYATGNRTVRGLEAVTLCLPPSPGESIIKQENNANLFSTGKILKNKGYTVQYLYGGDSYFDNMKTFFSGNGYDIIDKKAFTKDEISFSNIWGVCDEDIFNKAIKTFDKNHESGVPFFAHIMTVSNHRPFTYPAGKIDIPNDSRSRNGGVKYTDYALGKFIKNAKKQKWFNNTIFVILADHCASSAGKTQIPLEKYHIPAFIYAPSYIPPKKINKLISQIDIMPTLFGLLHFSYDSYFYGKNIFSPDYYSRTFAATYQNLGYWEKDILTILSPVKKAEQYQVQQDGYKFNLKYLKPIDSIYLKQGIANYQNVDNMLNRKIFD